MLPAYSAARHLNDRSLALLVRYGDFSVLLTGDAETAALTRLVRTGAVSDVTVLKASHHGSDNGFTDSLLAVARPEVVVISVGSGNAFGHPGALAVSAYYGAAAEVYRTDLDGTGTSARSTVSGRRRRRCLEGGLPSTSPLPYLTSQVTLHHKVIGKTHHPRSKRGTKESTTVHIK